MQQQQINTLAVNTQISELTRLLNTAQTASSGNKKRRILSFFLKKTICDLIGLTATFAQISSQTKSLQSSVNQLSQTRATLFAMINQSLVLQGSAETNMQTQNLAISNLLTAAHTQSLQVISTTTDFLTGRAPYRRGNRSVYTMLQQTRLLQKMFPFVSDWNMVLGQYGIRPHLSLPVADRIVQMDVDLLYYITVSPYEDDNNNQTVFLHQQEWQMTCSGESVALLAPVTTATIDLALAMIGNPGCNLTSVLSARRCTCVIEWAWRSCEVNTSLVNSFSSSSTSAATNMMNWILSSSSTSGQRIPGAFPIAVQMGDPILPITAFGCNSPGHGPGQTAKGFKVQGNATFDALPDMQLAIQNLCMGLDTYGRGGTGDQMFAIGANQTAFVVYSAGQQRTAYSFFNPSQCQVDPTTLYANFLLNGNRASVIQTVFNFWRDGTSIRLGSSYLKQLQYYGDGRLPQYGLGQRAHMFGYPAAVSSSNNVNHALGANFQMDAQSALEVAERTAENVRIGNLPPGNGTAAYAQLQALLAANRIAQPRNCIERSFISSGSNSIPVYSVQVVNTLRSVTITLVPDSSIANSTQATAILDQVQKQLNDNIQQRVYTQLNIASYVDQSSLLDGTLTWVGWPSCTFGANVLDPPLGNGTIKAGVSPGSSSSTPVCRDPVTGQLSQYLYDPQPRDMCNGPSMRQRAKGCANYVHLSLLNNPNNNTVYTFNAVAAKYLNKCQLGNNQTAFDQFIGTPAASLVNLTIGEMLAAYNGSCPIPMFNIQDMLTQQGFDLGSPVLQTSSMGFYPPFGATSAEGFRTDIIVTKLTWFDTQGNAHTGWRYTCMKEQSLKSKWCLIFDQFALEASSSFYGGQLQPDKWGQIVLWPFHEIQQVTILLPQYESQRFVASTGPCPLDVQAAGGRLLSQLVVYFIRPAFNVANNETFIDLVLNVTSFGIVGDTCGLEPLQMRLWASNSTNDGGSTTVTSNNTSILGAKITMVSDTLVDIVFNQCHASGFTLSRYSQPLTITPRTLNECWSWSNALSLQEDLATGQVGPNPPTSTSSDMAVTNSITLVYDGVENNDGLALLNIGNSLASISQDLIDQSNLALQNVLGLPDAWFTTNTTLNFTDVIPLPPGGGPIYLTPKCGKNTTQPNCTQALESAGISSGSNNSVAISLSQLNALINSSISGSWSTTGALEQLYQTVSAQVNAQAIANLKQGTVNQSVVNIGLALQAQLLANQQKSNSVLQLAQRANAAANNVLATYGRTAAAFATNAFAAINQAGWICLANMGIQFPTQPVYQV